MGEDPAGQPGQRCRDAERRNLIEVGVHADDLGCLFVLPDRQQSIAEAGAQDEPGAANGERGRSQHQIEKEQVGANDWQEKPGRRPERCQVVDDFSDRDTDAQGRDREVMPPQPEQRDADDQRKHGRRHRRDDQRQGERPAAAADQHTDGVGADPEEGDIPEAGIAGQAADDIPGGRHHDEHRHGGGDSEPELVGEQRQAGLLGRIGRGQRHKDHEGEQGDPDGQGEAAQTSWHALLARDHASRPRSPLGRTTSTMTSTTNAIAFA